jgi:hypothetical protein
MTELICFKLGRLQSEVCVLKGWAGAPIPQGWDSAIVCGFPAIFSEFRGKQFSLLWRGSRDGFRASDFHSRCDGHANTLTVILDTGGNIFGGLTPVEWESRTPNSRWSDWANLRKPDPCLKSFIFTLKNRHNVPARRFALNAEKNNGAIICPSNFGPNFGADIWVWDACNAIMNSSTFYFTGSYINDTGLDSTKLFTNSLNFQVKEIEVFEITA